MYEIERGAFSVNILSIFAKIVVAISKEACYPVYWKPNPLKGIPFEQNYKEVLK